MQAVTHPLEGARALQLSSAAAPRCAALRCAVAPPRLRCRAAQRACAPAASAARVDGAARRRGNQQTLRCAAVPEAVPAEPTAKRVPSMRELLAFTVPSMGIWLASPLLSLVDVSVVGLGSTLELAALGPATGVCDSSAYAFTFLAVATTSLIARAQARADTAASQSALADALTIAVACGLALGATLLLLAPALLSAYTGAASAAVVGPAVEYTRIRALGMPFGFVTMVSQAAFLAVKKPKQPMLAVAVASCVNLAGDLLLCCGLGLGVAGAAWATVASQVVASAVIVSRLSVPAAPGVPPLLAASAMTWLPRRAAVVAMLRVGGPVCLLIILKVLLVAVGITGAATRLSLLDSAVHGVMMTVYIFSATFGDAVSQSAQSFLPGLLGSPTAAFGLCRQLLITGAVVGTVNCACAGLVPVLSPGVFTTSAAVAAGMRQVAPTMCAALVLHSASMATEGLLLAGRDLRWLLVSYARNAALCVVTLTVTQRLQWGLPGVWAVLIQFHATRLAQNLHRLYISPASPLKSTAALASDFD